jgi:hypothetical protein
MTLTLGYYVEGKNPNSAAAIWQKDERITLNGTAPSLLKNKFVVRTGLTDVQLTSLDKKIHYKLGKDYEVINGDIALPYNAATSKPFAVVRTPDSSIADGQTVLAGYDYVSHYRASTNRTDPHIPYCPVEPGAQKIMGDYLKKLARAIPSQYILVVNDLEEFGPVDAQLATDSRVIKSGKTPIQLLANEMVFLNKEAKEGDPHVKLMMWTGQVNEYTKIAGPQIPKDVMMNIWGYDANWPVAYGRQAVKYWSKLGHETTVMPWNNLHNVRGWAQVVAEARALGYPCLGIIGSCWPDQPHGDAGMEETARVSWKIPQLGESGYVPLTNP